ncbi:MAG: hypothetical protein NZ920_01310 [Aigarchaeota archaeon]|nr:hypothetical protein [Aigarchaeota archaeon]MDW8093080.1 hypothetical protein [Nitrososphaerota archaeon]
MREVIYDLREFALSVRGREESVRMSFYHQRDGEVELVKATLFCPLDSHVLVWEDEGALVPLHDSRAYVEYELNVLRRIRDELGTEPKRGRWEG